MAKNSQNIPTLAQLARQYGTITEDQYTHLNRLYAILVKEKKTPDYGDLLLGQKMATSYQIGLIKLIQEYHIIRRKGEEFGKIAIKNGFATPADIRKALEIQKREFKESRLKKFMGDILVADGVITPRQKDRILKEQTLFDKKSKEILTRNKETQDTGSEDSTLHLSGYEQEFLRIKALDEEFSAAVVEKGLASEQEVLQAKKIQEESFEKKQPVKILGDIMVTLEFITLEQRNIILEEQGRTQEISVKDLSCSLSVGRDAMAAWIKIDTESGTVPDLGEIKSLLASNKILNGIYPDPLLQCSLDHNLSRFPVARTDYSGNLRDTRNLKTNFHRDENQEKRKGTLLAQQDSTWNMGAHKNIYGKKSSSFSDLDFTIRCGSGTRLSKDKDKDKSSIVASKTGVPAFSIERFLFVHPIINVLEDADQRYGPLEAYANLKVAGTITGAYPITAGHVRAREIRGAVITAIGGVKTDVGITDAVIRSQGDIHARYLHNCKIETFGTVYVKNEIFDSDIRCSGMVDSPDCRVIASQIHAKKGIILAGAGSEKTASCKITAGGEHHIIALTTSFMEEINIISRVLEDLKEARLGEERLAKRTFQQMVELKIFHDRAKLKKERLGSEFKKNKAGLDQQRLKNIIKLIASFERRMEKSIVQLKDLNQAKKKHDKTAVQLATKIQALIPKTAKKTRELEKSLFACLEWARSKKNSPVVKICGKAFQGTVFGGVYSTIRMDSHKENFSVKEIKTQENGAPVLKFFYF